MIPVIRQEGTEPGTLVIAVGNKFKYRLLEVTGTTRSQRADTSFTYSAERRIEVCLVYHTPSPLPPPGRILPPVACTLAYRPPVESGTSK